MSDDEHFPKLKGVASCGMYVRMLLKFTVMSLSYIPERINIYHQRQELFNELKKKVSEYMGLLQDRQIFRFSSKK